MTDGIIKGEGNSRFLKSAITNTTTWEEFRAALIAGNLPIDLNGINVEGWQQTGTPLNKAALLKDTTAAEFGKGIDAVPDDIFKHIGALRIDSETGAYGMRYSSTGDPLTIYDDGNQTWKSVIFTISKMGLSAGTNTVTFPTGKERASTDYIVIPVLRDYVNYSGQIYIQTKNTTGFTFYSTAASVVQTVDFVIIGGA